MCAFDNLCPFYIQQHCNMLEIIYNINVLWCKCSNKVYCILNLCWWFTSVLSTVCCQSSSYWHLLNMHFSTFATAMSTYFWVGLSIVCMPQKRLSKLYWLGKVSNGIQQLRTKDRSLKELNLWFPFDNKKICM